jgi:hypothetical protein
MILPAADQGITENAKTNVADDADRLDGLAEASPTVKSVMEPMPDAGPRLAAPSRTDGQTGARLGLRHDADLGADGHHQSSRDASSPV